MKCFQVCFAGADKLSGAGIEFVQDVLKFNKGIRLDMSYIVVVMFVVMYI